MNKKTLNGILIALGVILLAAGLLWIKNGASNQLPYLCVGVGSGLFGQGLGEVIAARTRRTDPERMKRMEIGQKDERSVAISNMAKGKAFDLMTGVFGALMICFALMGVEPAPLLLLVFAYLLVHGAAVYHRIRLEREM